MSSASAVVVAPAAARSRYSVGEEIANSASHGIGVALAITALVLLVAGAAREGDPWRITAFSIYGTTLILMYLASALYHGIPHAAAKPFLQRLDHAAIYLLIAGSYTPVLLVTLRGVLGWSMFGWVWSVAIVGVMLEFLAGRRWRKLSLIVYVALGWTCLAAIHRVSEAYPPAAMAWLVAGGVTYTAGIAFYLCRRLPYSHAIWHLFVLGGSICHFFLFFLYVLPPERV